MDATAFRLRPSDRTDSRGRRPAGAARRRTAGKPGDSRTRILAILKAQGPRSATRIAEQLGVTPMAARQHLLAMAEAGLVAYEAPRGKVGRPTKLWRLTPQAEDRAPQTAPGFADGHDQLAVELLSCLTPEALAAALALREKRLGKLYGKGAGGKGLDKKTPLRARLERLAAYRTAEGYMAEVAVSEDGWYLLVQSHCPIRAAACACPALCDSELRAFKKALGKDVTLERREHRLSGDRRCSVAVKRKAKG
jgi:predicted ArsR family transcriptional regulator